MRGAPLTYIDFSGGVNLLLAPYDLTDTQAREVLNVHTSLQGDIEKRPGFVTLSGATLTGSPVNGKSVHTLFPVNAATKSLMGVTTTSTTDTIFKLTSAGTASVLKSGLTANTRWWFAQAGVNAASGPIFGLNGVDTPVKWNGESATAETWTATTGTVPKEAKFLTYWNTRLWCAKGSRVYFSGITESSADPLNWATENYVDLEPNDGQEITGMGIVGAYLVVFKARKIFAIYDAASGANRQISNSVGCVAPRSIAQTPQGLFFLSEDQGICSTNGSSVEPFSDPLLPLWEEVAKTPSSQALAAATTLGRRYFLSVARSSVKNDTTVEYDLASKSWWIHSCASNQFALLDPNGAATLYSADSTESARVSKAFVNGTYTDNGSAFESYWASPWYAPGIGGGGINPHVAKRIREIRVDGVGNWNAELAFDFENTFEQIEGEIWETRNNSGGTFGGAGTFGGSGTFGESNLVNVDRHYLTPGLGRSYSLRFVNKEANAFRIYSTTFALTPRTN